MFDLALYPAALFPSPLFPGTGATVASSDNPSTWLCSIGDVEATLGTRFAARPDVPDLVDAASRMIELACHRTFAQGPVTDVLDGNGRAKLLLSRPPVAPTGISVIQDGTPIDNSLGDQWTLDPDSGVLLRGNGQWASAYGFGYPAYPGATLYLGYGWNPGFRNVQVSYVGGYSPIPSPIRRACVALVKHLADASQYTGLFTMERIGDYEYTIGSPEEPKLPWVVEALIAPYVLSRIG